MAIVYKMIRKKRFRHFFLIIVSRILGLIFYSFIHYKKETKLKFESDNMIIIKDITEDNFRDVVNLKNEKAEINKYISSIVFSLVQAWLYKDNNDVFPKSYI